MKLVLNVGSGQGVLPYQEFIRNISCKHELVIYNLDIYDDTVTLGYVANVENSNVKENIDFRSGDVHIVLAISPYAFPVINSETVRVLESGGYFIVVGNQHNKYLKDEKLIQDEMRHRVREIPNWMHGGESTRVCQDIIFHILFSYTSRTTDGSNTTFLDKCRLFVKV